MKERLNAGYATLICACALIATAANAALDLRNASVSHLENGLTVILLEDRNFPVVSMQTLYRTGARDETTGETGLAHFLEHMAFRSTESFPDTGVVSEIYARGGEWHGYTWTDETTYFATVPKQHLDLLLRIESERMSRLTIDPHDMEAERGAVLAEMHGYENDPGSVLLDAVLFASFLGHPYRNNTIGWQSDIEHLLHEDVVAFYKQHYVPANAVVAVVGDFDPVTVSQRIAELFGPIEARPATALPHTIEPPQTGERRVRLAGPGNRKRFSIAWHAPAASSPDYPAFLVLQDWLGGSSGINFLQNDWGTPVRRDSLLYGTADDVTTWFPPSAQDYVFLVSGSAAADANEADIETKIEKRIEQSLNTAPDADTLAASVGRILDQLVFDVETTEDAAHQLAFFEGLGALDMLRGLPQILRSVTPADVQAVARRYLRPEQRTIGWWVPGAVVITDHAALAVRKPAGGAHETPIDTRPVDGARIARLSNGMPVIVMASDLSSSVHLRVVMPNSRMNDPVAGHVSLDYLVRPDATSEAIVLSARDASAFNEAAVAEPSSDPETRLEQAMTGIMGNKSVAGRRSPSLIVVAGDVQADAIVKLLNDAYKAMRPGKLTAASKSVESRPEINIKVGHPIAQAQLGYVLPAPAPRDPEASAYRLLLYVLSHHYEGRLGKKAISERGLAYYIDSRYRSDGESAWITMATGVDPEKLDALMALIKAELERLRTEPPTAAEIEEAREYLVGRAGSAAQSNEELTALLATQWVWYGRLQTPDELREQLNKVSDDQVRAIAGKFSQGTMIRVME
jgi:zinc protease